MKRILLLIVVAWINAAQADELAPLIKSIGACKHLSVGRGVHPGDEEGVGTGFKYGTSDPKMIARVLKYFESLPARDTWYRFRGKQPIPDAVALLSLQFQRADGRKVSILVIEPRELVFESNQLFDVQVRDLLEFYRIIGKGDAVPPSFYVAIPLELYRYDGTDDFHTRQRKVRDVQPVERQPLFDNVPFFRLRVGDRLVKARDALGPGKAKPGKKREDLQYYLESNGSYFQLRTEEKDGKRLLSKTPDSASACVLFDWDVTLANANAIRAMLPGEWSESFSPEKYDEIVRATRSRFPKFISKETVLKPSYLLEDLIDAIPGISPFAHLEGLLFDSQQSAICKYDIRISPDSFSVRTTTLLQGPRRIERSRPEAAEGKHKGNSDPAVAQRMKAEDEQAIEFQKMVQGIIQSGGNAGGETP